MGNFFAKLIEPPRDHIPAERQMFSNLDLKKLIIPLICEQVLVMMVGMVIPASAVDYTCSDYIDCTEDGSEIS